VARPATPPITRFLRGGLQRPRTKGRRAEPAEYDSAHAVRHPTSEQCSPRGLEDSGDDPRFRQKFSAWLKGHCLGPPARTSRVQALRAVRAGVPTPPDKAEAFSRVPGMEEGGGGRTRAECPIESLGPRRGPPAPWARIVNAVGLSTTVRMASRPPSNAIQPVLHPPLRLWPCRGLACRRLGSARPEVLPALSWGWRSTRQMLALVIGIGLRSSGSSMRVRISGLAPVTNMYETVIWVSLSPRRSCPSSLEMIFRKTTRALACSGGALLGTLLARTCRCWTPASEACKPFLRSNYWLTDPSDGVLVLRRLRLARGWGYRLALLT